MTRRGTVFFACVLLLWSGLAVAQNAPAVEIFGGYQFLRAHSGINVGGLDNFSLNGWDASLSGYFNHYLGVTGDFAGTYGTPRTTFPQIGQVAVNTHLYTFMAGPVLRISNKSPFQPFAHVLLGGAHVRGSASLSGVGGTTFTNTNTGFAWAPGGGLDLKLLPLIGVRLAQVDLVQTRIGGNTQNNFRYSAGIVVRF
jgi:hypothetical protein